MNDKTGTRKPVQCDSRGRELNVPLNTSQRATMDRQVVKTCRIMNTAN